MIACMYIAVQLQVERLLMKSDSKRCSRQASWLVFTGFLLSPSYALAGEGPFFVTYTHQMEEPGNLEITTKNVTGEPGDGNRFLGSVLELEYGVKGWWTTELYLDGQGTSKESALF